MINITNLQEMCGVDDTRLSTEQLVMAKYNMNKGFKAYIEAYSDYCYLVLVKEGVKNGIKRLNKSGHNVYI